MRLFVGSQHDLHQAKTIIWNGPMGVFEMARRRLSTCRDVERLLWVQHPHEGPEWCTPHEVHNRIEPRWEVHSYTFPKGAFQLHQTTATMTMTTDYSDYYYTAATPLLPLLDFACLIYIVLHFSHFFWFPSKLRLLAATIRHKLVGTKKAGVTFFFLPQMRTSAFASERLFLTEVLKLGRKFWWMML